MGEMHESRFRSFADKIVSAEKLEKELEVLRREGKVIVFTNGCFDILHAGHVRYLNDAGTLGDLLILALNSDSSVRSIKGDLRPIVPQDERACVAASLEAVDYVVIFDEETPLKLIERLKPDILVKGGDWSEENVAGGEFVKKRGGRVAIIPQTKGLSTTNIIEKIRKICG